MTTLTHGSNSECPEVRMGNWTRCQGHEILEPKQELADATLALELHLLATLLKRHKHLIAIRAEDWGFDVDEVHNFSDELHPTIAIDVRYK